LILLTFALSGRSWGQGLMLTVVFLLVGFMFPDLWLTSRVNRRQKGVFRAMPDALDLLTICVEAGLGFDAAMAKVQEKWDNELALEFGRVIQEIRLGKLRRDALRDMAERAGVAELTSFVAAVIQSEQLGVSLAKVLRIQSDQMRVRRRQMAEEEAHKAPIKMIFPIALLIFPSILIVLLGPAAMLLMTSALGGILLGR
jgi:tight adherence protein C